MRFRRFSGLFSVVFALMVCGGQAWGGTVIHVDGDANGVGDGSSWVDAYNHLRMAIEATEGIERPVEIRVAEGVYKPTDGLTGFLVDPLDIEDSFTVVNGLVLSGGYAGDGADEPNERDIEAYETILSGRLEGYGWDRPHPGAQWELKLKKARSRHVVTVEDTNGDTVVDGFTITGGNAGGGGLGRLGRRGAFRLQ